MNTSASSDLPDAVERVARSVLAVAASRRGVGSATVWRDRFIVAAAHRVWRTDSAQVVLPDGETASAAVKGVDPATDLALLALDASAPALPVPQRADDAAGSRAGLPLDGSVARDSL